MKQLARAVPDVFVWAYAEFGPKLIFKGLPDEAVNTVRGNQQIAIRLERLDFRNFVPKLDFDAELFAALLQDLEQAQAGYSGKAVAMDGNFLAAMNDIDVVPGFKVPRDFRVRRPIG